MFQEFSNSWLRITINKNLWLNTFSYLKIRMQRMIESSILQFRNLQILAISNGKICKLKGMRDLSEQSQYFWHWLPWCTFPFYFMLVLLVGNWRILNLKDNNAQHPITFRKARIRHSQHGAMLMSKVNGNKIFQIIKKSIINGSTLPKSRLSNRLIQHCHVFVINKYNRLDLCKHSLRNMILKTKMIKELDFRNKNLTGQATKLFVKSTYSQI